MASTSNSNTTNDNNNGEKASSPRYEPQYTGGMTPSIITTINNTSPTPLFTITDQQPHENHRDPSKPDSSPKDSAARTVIEPPAYYESYIEDSFVGHWEREDDDPDYNYRANRGSNESHPTDEDEDESIHPSTIEFDFDSFGPESFIYTPAVAAAAKAAPQSQPAADSAQVQNDEVVPERVDSTSQQDEPARPASANEQKEEREQQQQPRPEELCLPSPQQCSTSTMSVRPANSPAKICELKPSPVDYLVDPAQIDLKVIEPYKKVISHAGYCHHFDPSVPPPKPGEPAPAIIVFSACYLPDRSRRDYDYVMDHLFLYVLSSLHELIADDYILIYLHNTQPSTTFSTSSLLLGGSSSSASHSANGSSTHSSGNQEELPQNNLPTFTWMKRCYQMIDRRLRKNLKILYLVKPTFWLKTIVIMCRPFISSKFSKKLRFIEDMEALRRCLPVDQLILPASADCL